MSVNIVKEPSQSLSKASIGHTHSHHPSREATKSQLPAEHSGDIRETTGTGNTFGHVTGSIPSKTNVQFLVHPDRMHEMLSYLVPILSNHPDFQDGDWSGAEPVDMVLAFMVKQFKKITPEKFIISISVNDNGELQPYRILPCPESYDYGNMISCDWIRRLSKSNRSAYKIAISFLSFCFQTLHIPIWNEYEEECHIDYLQEELYYYKEEHEEMPDGYEFLTRDISYFNTYALGHYGHKIINRETSIQGFSEELAAYHPRKKKYQAFKTWMEEAITLSKLGYDFSESHCPHFIHQSYDNGEYEPYRYCRFIWSDSDAFGSSLVQGICENAGNVGIIPLIDYELITAENIAVYDSLGLSSRFYNWMSAGHAVTSQLY